MGSGSGAQEETIMFISQNRGAGVLLALGLAAAFAIMQLSAGAF